MSFAERLKELREEKELTQTELGKIFSLSKQTISSYENGGSTPGQETLKKIADFFNVSIDYLLGHTNVRILDIVDIFQSDDIKITASGKPLTQEQRLNLLRTLNNIPQTNVPIKIPILGTIRAGIPLLSEQNIIGHLDIPTDLSKKADFALVVRGDSMIGAGINEGDYAICKQREAAINGQIVVALVDGSETTLKYYIQENGKAVLRAANPEFRDIELKKGDSIQGYVVKILKDPPSINSYREFLYFKDGHLQEWNMVIEEAVASGIKPSIIKEFVKTQIEIAKKLLGK